MSFKTYAEINLDNLAHNIGRIREKVAPSGMIPIIKADAYGHGAVPVARRLAVEGCTMFAVARIEEALELRESGIDRHILILGRLFPDDIAQAVKAGLIISIFGEEDLRWVEKACGNSGRPPASVHLKLDTGMGRVGLLLDKAADLFDRLAKSRSCVWQGIYTHFSTSDEKDKDYANLQLSRFREVLAMLPNDAERPKIIVHMAASGAILDLPDSYFDAVRPGIPDVWSLPVKGDFPEHPAQAGHVLENICRSPAGNACRTSRQLRQAVDHARADQDRGPADWVC